MKIQSEPGSAGNVEDHAYVRFLDSFREQFLQNISADGERLFTTDADPNDLWSAYLGAFAEGAERQHHNCHTCRHFIQRYANLVTIDEQGRTKPAVLYGQNIAFNAMYHIVSRAKVTGVFYSQDLLLGVPVTGPWRHMSLVLPQVFAYAKVIQTPEQAAAEKKEDFKNICRALSEYPLTVVDAAIQVLNSEQLYRSEKVLGQATFLRELHEARERAVSKANVTWKKVASAPAGFCHPRASMIGTLLDDIAAGMDFASLRRRFATKMHPLLYQRPQAPPKEQTIDRAEKIIADLGLTGSLRRRYALVHEVEKLWTPRPSNFGIPEPPGVFDHLRRGAFPHQQVMPGTQTCTWEKFARVVLPEAKEISFISKRYRDNYCVMVTAADPSAPPILQWDRADRRNPFSSYIWHGGSSPSQFGLQLGDWHQVSAITLRPSMWYGEDYAHMGKGVIFCLAGAQETRQAGAAIFPENLRSELHGVRSVIEAHSKSSSIEMSFGGAQAVGILLQQGVPWDYLFRVKFSRNIIQDYLLDRWD